MKKLIATALVLMTLASCGQKGTTVEIKLTGISDFTTVEVIGLSGDDEAVVLSEPLKDGSFEYTMRNDSIADDNTQYAIMLVDGNKRSRHRIVYLKPNSMATIVGTSKYPAEWTITSEHPHQAYDNRFQEVLKDINNEIQDINYVRDTIRTEEGMRAVSAKINEIYDRGDKLRIETMRDMPVDEYWIQDFAMLTSSVIGMDENYPLYDSIKELYNKMSEADKATPVGKRITINLFGKAPAIGDKLTDYDLYDINGNVHHLAEFKGKMMIVDFSSYYCGPCRMFSATEKYFYQKGYNDKLEIVTVTYDTQKQFEEMVATENFISPLWNDRDEMNGIFALYKIQGVPTFYVIDPEGTIVDNWFGLDMNKFVKTIHEAGCFPAPEIKTENGVTTVESPSFTENIGGLLIDKVTISKESVIVDCIFPVSGNYSINSSFGLYVKGKKVSKIVSSSIGLDSPVPIQLGEVGHCTLTFEPLPKGTKEFDFIEDYSERCFQVTGVKITE